MASVWLFRVSPFKATRLMRSHLEAVQELLEQDPGAMSLQVALAEVHPGMRR